MSCEVIKNSETSINVIYIFNMRLDCALVSLQIMHFSKGNRKVYDLL